MSSVLVFLQKYWKKVRQYTVYTEPIPFGGSIKIFGEDPHAEVIDDENKKNSFYYKPKIIQAAGLLRSHF